MPIIKSAKKRVRTANKATVRNFAVRRKVRDSFKEFKSAINSGKPADIAKAEQAAVSALDLAVKKNVIHKNKAARRKSQMAYTAKAAGTKKTRSVVKTTKKPASKTAPKKPTAKKSTK